MEELLDYLEKNYGEMKVAEMLDEEIHNWVESDWEDNYESEYDWYLDHNNNEAEDVIINKIKSEVAKNLPDLPTEIDVIGVIKELYVILD